MLTTRFPVLPDKAFTHFGGFTWVKKVEWLNYLDRMIQDHLTVTFGWEELSSHLGKDWQDNSCVYNSLREYLFAQFGMLIPQESLFQLYNDQGEGILPSDLIEAIQSIVEPVGFELDKVLVPDKHLRLGMGRHPALVDMSQEEYLDGKPGVCMINIKDGYNHAFYWNKIEKGKFHKEQFRMAVLVKRPAQTQVELPSAIHCFDEYTRFMEEQVTELAPGSNLLANLKLLRREIILRTAPVNCESLDQIHFGFERILGEAQDLLSTLLHDEQQLERNLIMESGNMVSTILGMCLQDGLFIN